MIAALTLPVWIFLTRLDTNETDEADMAKRGGKGRRKVGRKKRRMRAKIRHRK
jgi:hypothetical protein